MPPMPVTRFMVFSCSWARRLRRDKSGIGSEFPPASMRRRVCQNAWMLLLEASIAFRAERSRAYFAAAGIARNQRTARRAGLAHQAERGRLCIVAEQALAVTEHHRINHQPKVIHQSGREQLLHHVAASPGQQRSEEHTSEL